MQRNSPGDSQDWALASAHDSGAILIWDVHTDQSIVPVTRLQPGTGPCRFALALLHVLVSLRRPCFEKAVTAAACFAACLALSGAALGMLSAALALHPVHVPWPCNFILYIEVTLVVHNLP